MNATNRGWPEMGELLRVFNDWTPERAADELAHFDEYYTAPLAEAERQTGHHLRPELQTALLGLLRGALERRAAGWLALPEHER